MSTRESEGMLLPEPSELPAAEQVHVKVKYFLVGVAVAVDQQPISAFGNAFLLGNYRGNGKHMADQLLIFGRNIIDRGDFLVGDNENVGGGLGFDVAKSSHLVVLVDNVAGNFAFDDFGITGAGSLISFLYDRFSD